MNENDMEPCYERLVGVMKCLKILILMNTVVLTLLTMIVIAGFFISYKETYKDVYHTSFVNQDIIKQLYGVDIQ